MKVIQTSAEVGEERVLQVQLPADVPPGTFDVVVVLESRRHRMSREERRAAALAGLGALKEFGGSVADFLAERRAEEIRRERALGL